MEKVITILPRDSYKEVSSVENQSSGNSSTEVIGTVVMIGNNARNVADFYFSKQVNVTLFNSVDEALNFMRKSEVAPYAILCDPDFSSSVIKQLILFTQLYHKSTYIPIIAIAGKLSESVCEQAFDLGFDDIYSISDAQDKVLTRITFLKKIHAKNTFLNSMSKQVISCRYKISFRKRLFDVLFSGLALTLLSPILLIIAVIIKLESKGPVFYISKRAGTGYQIFNFYKFRSMRTGADQELARLMALNQYSDSAFFKLKKDPRVTPFGRFLRNTSLDELPQLINVLIGDMSIVGNRPLSLYEAEQLTADGVAQRFLAPAGITGLWQVTKRGKSEMSEEERKNLDVSYASERDGWFDLKIIFKTFPALIQQEAV